MPPLLPPKEMMVFAICNNQIKIDNEITLKDSIPCVSIPLVSAGTGTIVLVPVMNTKVLSMYQYQVLILSTSIHLSLQT